MNFLNPTLLLALGAIAIPIAIHFISRNQPRNYPFPSLRFLSHQKLDTVSKKKLSNPWLLLLRILAYCSIILFFAKPFFPEDTSNDKASSLGIIFVDTSASLNSPEFQNQLTQACDSLLDSHDQFILSTDLKFENKRLSQSELKQQLNSIKPGFHTTNPSAIIEKLKATLQNSTEQITMHILSDFQESNWKWNTPISFPGQVQFHSLKELNNDNVSIISLNTITSPDNSSLEINALLTNHGSVQHHIKLQLDYARQSFKQSQALAPFEKKRIKFTVKKSSSTNNAKIHFPLNDAFHHDNSYTLWCGDSPRPTLAHFTPANAPKSLNPYLKTALALNDQLGRSSPSQAISDLNQLNQTRALFVGDEFSRLSSEQHQQIQDFVAQGGLLILAPGNQARASFLQLNNYPKISIRQTKPTMKSGPYYFSIADKQISELIPFRNSPEADLTLCPIFRFNPLESNGQTFLNFNENSPALIRFPFEKGQIIVSTLPFEPDWSDFPFSKSFLPLMRHLVFQYSPKSQNIIKIAPQEGSLEPKILTPSATKIKKIIYEINPSPLESIPRPLDPLILKQQFSLASKNIDTSHTRESSSSLPRILILSFFAFLLLESILLQFSPRPKKQTN